MQRVPAHAKVQAGVGGLGPEGVAALVPPAEVSRQLYPGVRTDLLEAREARGVCQGPPEDTGGQRVGPSVARGAGLDPQTVRQDDFREHVRGRHAVQLP